MLAAFTVAQADDRAACNFRLLAFPIAAAHTSVVVCVPTNRSKPMAVFDGHKRAKSVDERQVFSCLRSCRFSRDCAQARANRRERRSACALKYTKRLFSYAMSAMRQYFKLDLFITSNYSIFNCIENTQNLKFDQKTADKFYSTCFCVCYGKFVN